MDGTDGSRPGRSGRRFRAFALLAAVHLLPAVGPGGAPALEAATNRVGRFETLEFRLDPGASYTNVFDPAEVDFRLEVRGPGGGVTTVPAFWTAPHALRTPPQGERRREWTEPDGAPGWRARFAPVETGRHSAVARLRDRRGESASGAVAFEAVASTNRGYVRVSRRDPRFFELDDGTPFFAIGQDVAFVGPMQRVTPGRVGGVLRRMAGNGANYARVWTCCGDWAMSLEPGRGGAGPSDGRSRAAPAPDAPRGMGVYNQPDAAILDRVVAEAEAAGIRLQLCLLTRDRYMGRLKQPDGPDYAAAIRDARNLLRYAIARWGASTAVAAWEYWNEQDPGLPAGRFYADLGAFVAGTDPWRHLRSTSAWAPAPKDWTHPDLDVADLHWYLRPNWNELWKDAAAAVADRAAFLRSRAPARPALLSEFGLADEKWGPSPFMKQDRDLLHVHDALWASAMSGLSGTVMFWWWERLDEMDGYRHYRPLADFVAGIPWTTGGLRSIDAAVSPAPRLRVAGLQGAGGAWAWLSDADAAWWNVVVDGRAPQEVRGAALSVAGLADGEYDAGWWDTTAGRVLREDRVAVRAGRLDLAVPPFLRDIAVRIAPAPGDGRGRAPK